jgi:hypothetical protein
LLTLFLGLVVLTGCGTTSLTGAGPQRSGDDAMQEPAHSAPDKGSPGVQAMPLSGLGTPEQALPELAAGDLTGLCALPWHLARVENDGRRLLLLVPASPAVVKGVRVRETPEEVEVTVYRTLPAMGLTTPVSIHATFAVDLAGALGQRRLTGADGTSCR